MNNFKDLNNDQLQIIDGGFIFTTSTAVAVAVGGIVGSWAVSQFLKK